MTQAITVEAGFVTHTITTEDEATEILQPIMNVAYEKYQVNRNWGFGDFLMNLDVKVRQVVAIGKLNQQVCNGGFMQWRDNGYDEKPEFLFQALETLGTDAAKKVLDLVEQALSIDTEPEEDEDGYCDEHEMEMIGDAFDPLDNAFYEINQQMLCDLAIHVLTGDVLAS